MIHKSIRGLMVYLLAAICVGCSTKSVKFPEGITKIIVYDPYHQTTNRVLRAPNELQRVMAFTTARTNGWRRTSWGPEMGKIEAHFFRGDQHLVTLGASAPRFNYGWWLTKRARKSEVIEFFSLLGEDYHAHFPNK